jgi:phosphatidylserine/phosphatidylglycerophosphate/cardiolipin synthase-like enzyme
LKHVNRSGTPGTPLADRLHSFSLNDEATLNIMDAGFAAQQTEVFEQGMASLMGRSCSQGR